MVRCTVQERKLEMTYIVSPVKLAEKNLLNVSITRFRNVRFKQEKNHNSYIYCSYVNI